jgi:probable H4MPT-linked C1 transfer pathway protein
MNKSPIVGWDVGGAHLKAALLDEEGKLLHVIQVPCALWRGLSELENAIDAVLGKFGISTAQHAITMTGELVDLFANRQVGVNEISRMMHAKLGGTQQFYSGALKPDFTYFVAVDEVDAHWQHIASANWLASAGFVAQHVEHGLLIDIGSTTTDLVLIERHIPICLGFTDAARMQTEELVYTGVIRTPLMAITQKIEFQNIQTSVAAEYFSTSADVYRLTGDLAVEDDMADTADGKDKSSLASAQRIARMIGHDASDSPFDTWIALAQSFKQLQLIRLQEVAEKQIARLKDRTNVVIIGAGTGKFMVREIAAKLDIPYVEVADLLGEMKATSHTKHWASVCLPAYAVAYLAFNNKNNHSI